MNEIGRLSLLIAFLCAVFSVGSIAWGLRTGRVGLLRGGRNALWAVCGMTVLATIILGRALVARDFTYRYVAEHTSLDLSPSFSFASLWAGQEGSLLLWLLILSSYGAADLRRVMCRRSHVVEGSLGARAGQEIHRSGLEPSDQPGHHRRGRWPNHG